LLALAAGMLVPAVYAYWRDWTGARLTIDRAVLGTVARYGIPISVTVALAAVIGSSDRFLIASMLGERSAGLYSVAVDLTSQTLTLLMIVINMAMFPLAVRAYEERGVTAAANQMRHNAALLLAVGVPATVGLAVLAPSISHTFLGKDFRDAAVGIIPMVAVGTFLAGYKAYQLDSAFQFAHRTIHQVWIVLVAAVINVVLNVLMIKPYGIQGAAAASVIAYLVSMVLTAWVGRRHFPLPFPVAACGQVLVATAAMTLVLWPLRDHFGTVSVAIQVVAGGLTYGVILVATNFLDLRTALLAKFAPSAQQASAMASIVE
jgi:O-antigen/teichoic acid export membrane protein